MLLAVVSTGSGIAALWYAVRVEIDRRLFAALARAVDGDGSVDAGLEALDRALADLGWIDTTKAGRTLDARVRGAVGLCRAAVLVAVVQWLVVGIAIAVSPIG
ncbi:membrane protein [Burkholderia sola]|nr:membrane protein [Burkholderia cenocepacia]